MGTKRPLRTIAATMLAAGAAMLLLGGDVRAQEGADDELVVVAIEFEPFVVREGDLPGGFMFETWQQIAAGLELAYEVRWIETLDDLGEIIASGTRADVIVAPVSTTEAREGRLDFTSPVVTSGPVIGVHSRTENPITLVDAVLSRDIIRLLGFSAIGLLVLGHAMWLVDRRNPDSDFAEGYLAGVWDGVWWALVTVTTVGYGDSTPRTNGGRVVAMFAMVGSLFLVGAFVSEVSTELNSNRAESVISGLDDLGDRPVGVVDGSLYARLLDERGVNTVLFGTQLEAFEAADDGSIDVVVTDRYAVETQGAEYGLSSSGEVLFDEFVSFAVPQGSELRGSINGELVRLQQDGVVNDIIDRWTN